MNLSLPIYTIYDHPTDYPEHFVVRRAVINNEGNIIPDEKLHLQTNSLEMIHAIMQSDGLVFMGKHPNDDEKIIGTYI